MARRVLLCLSHSIEEHDQIKLLTGLGYEVASLGGYIDPRAPHDPKRPDIDVPCYATVKDAVDGLGADDNIGAAQSRIPEAILEWLGVDGVIIFHHYLERCFGQWEHLREWRASGGRVIWRTVGQSVADNELRARPFRDEGLEIVRYSPKEKNIPNYAGEDALIRFYKDATEWSGWTGEDKTCINITQHLKQRDPYTNYGFWQAATEGLPAQALGPGSEEIGGHGEMTMLEMHTRLKFARCYLYTGTQPASYTLGLLEALMTGIPVISIGPNWMTMFPYGSEMFEAHELCGAWSDIPAGAGMALKALLADDDLAANFSEQQRRRTVEAFSAEVVGAAWREHLGAP